MKKNLLQLLLLLLVVVPVMAQQQVGTDIYGLLPIEESGTSIDMSADGTRIVVGAPRSNANGTESGQVRVFDFDGNDWVQVGNSINGESSYDFSGTSVSITADGNRLVVGAPMNDGPDPGDDNKGHLRIFDLVGNVWTQVGSDIDGAAPLDQIGHDAAISANGNRVACFGRQSQVETYELIAGEWTQVGQTIIGADVFVYEPGEVALTPDGSRLIAGFPRENGAAGTGAGVVRIYDLIGGNWNQVGQALEGYESYDEFGVGLAISDDGNRVVAGGHGGYSIPSCSSWNASGYVRIFDWISGNWLEMAYIPAEDCNNRFGSSVDITSAGNRIVVGGNNNSENAFRAGHVRVYDNVGNYWIQVGDDIDGEQEEDWMGQAVAISSDGAYITCSAFRNDYGEMDAGQVQVYNRFYGVNIFEGNASCIGANNGSIEIFSSGLTSPFEYSYTLIFEDGSTIGAGQFLENIFSFEDLLEGDYTFSVFDENGALVSEEIVVVTGVVGSIFEILDITTVNSVNNLPSGAISIVLDGGSPEYTLNWTGPTSGSTTSNTPSFDVAGLSAGLYSLFIIDDLGNIITQDVTIVNEENPAETCALPLDIIIMNDCSGSVDATEYEESKAFFVNFCNSLNVGLGADDTNVAIAEFSSGIQELKVPITGNLPDLQEYENTDRSFFGGTNPNEALTFGHDYLEQNGRDDVTKIIVLSTDALSSQVGPSLIALSEQYQAEGYVIVTIAFDDAFSNPITQDILAQTATVELLAPGANAYSELTDVLAEYIVNVYVCSLDPGASNTIYFNRDGVLEIIGYNVIDGDCNDFESIEVEILVTAQQQLSLPAGTPISFYYNNPELFSSTPILTTYIPCALEADESETITVTLPVSGPAEIWAVLNDNGSQAPPINLPNTEATELVYINNFDQIAICVDDVPTVSVLKYTPTPIPVCGNTVIYTIDVCNISNLDLVDVQVVDEVAAGFELIGQSVNTNGCAQGDTLFDIPVGCCVSLTYEYDVSNAPAGFYNNQSTTLTGPTGQVYLNFDGQSSTSEDVLVGDEIDCDSDEVLFGLTVNNTDVCNDQFITCAFELTNNTNVALQAIEFESILPNPVTWGSEPYFVTDLSISSSFITGSNLANFMISEIPPNTTGTFFIDIYVGGWGNSGTFDITAVLSQLPSFVNGTGDDISVSSSTIYVNAGPFVITTGEIEVEAGDSVAVSALLIGGQNPVWVTAGDGVFDNPNSNITFYFPGPEDIADGEVQITIEAENSIPGCGGGIGGITIIIEPSPCITPIVTSTTETYCQGDTIDVFGEAITTSGLYETVLVAADGCDSLVQINLILNATYEEVIPLEFCEGDTAFIAGLEITNDEIVTENYFTQNGCDSIEQISIVFLSNIQTESSLESCEGDTAYIFSLPQISAGIFTESFQAFNGCDSIHQITLSFNTPVFTDELLEICEGESIEIFGIDESSAGNYESTFTGFNNCDSTHQIDLVVNENISTSEILSICEGEAIDIFGNTETQAGIYESTFTGFNNCDSTHQITLQVNELIYTYETMELCDGEVATIFGSPETDPGMYSAVFVSNNGCDSIHQINLTFNAVITTTETLNICEGESILIFGNEETVADVYQASYTTINNCDSTHQITLQVNQLEFTTETIIICEGESTLVFGNPETIAGTYEELFNTYNNCDSTHQIDLVVNENISTSEILSICEGEAIDIFGNTETQAGIYESTFSGFNNCDSTHQVTLEVNELVNTYESLTYCEGETVIVFGNPETTTGIYIATFTADSGCDSTHQIDLFFNDLIETNESLAICEGESILIFGNEEEEEGFYEETYTSMSGCDSIHQVALSVNEAVASFETTTICEGESANIFGNTETQAGTYEAVFVGVNNCDSVHQINLVINENIQTTNSLSICEGTSISIFGNEESVAGVYENTYTAFNGCDSMHQVMLSVKLSVFTTESLEFCAGEIVTINGSELTEDAMIEQTFTGYTGCDSTHIVDVFFVEQVDDLLFDTLCGDDFTLFFDDTIRTAGTFYQSVIPLGDGCDTNYILEVVKGPEIDYTIPDTVEAYKDELFQLPLVSNEGNITFEWSFPELLNCPDCSRPLATLEADQTFTVTITNEWGCQEAVSVAIKINERLQVYIPNSFSPNGDGINDYFNVFTNFEDIQIEKFQVYNRWGALVYDGDELTPNAHSEGWNGVFKGKNLGTGIYVYQIVFRLENGDSMLKSGDVLLVR